MDMADLVLVTGGTGFVGIHCVALLLRKGYRVRTTVRSMERAGDVLGMLERDGLHDAEVECIAADLKADAGWQEAVQGCRYVLHVASPFYLEKVRHEDELVVPAREGTLRVLKAARDAGVERVVLTSSIAAIAYGHAEQAEPFTEQDWTRLGSEEVSPYIKSKMLAERAAWDFMASEGSGMQMVAVNPVGIFGPALGPKLSTSVEMIQKMLKGELPGLPRMTFGAVDVRDVAELEWLAMTAQVADGQRYIAVAGEPLPLVEFAHMLKRHLGAWASKVPTRVVPDWVMRLGAMVKPELRYLLPQLGKSRRSNANKAMSELGWRPRSAEESVNASADSLFELGLV